MTDPRPVEAVLFTSGSYLSAEEISELAAVEEEEVPGIIEDLRESYADMDRALTLFEEKARPSFGTH